MKIHNFDEYCRALATEGEVRDHAELLHFLRSWMIGVQRLDIGSAEEKLGYVGLSELLQMPLSSNESELARIAKEVSEAIRHIAASFRTRIVRENILMPIHRAKEINGAGLAWLGKQSGRTIREKLSASNRMLAVRRRLSLDTGENRLFFAFIAELEEFIEQKRLANSAFVAEAELNFQENARKLLHSEEAEEIARWENAPPNNTLLSDRFYRRIWHSWIDLQQLSQMIRDDSENLDARLCTMFFWCLLQQARFFCRFAQQPVCYDYAKFFLEPPCSKQRGGILLHGWQETGFFSIHMPETAGTQLHIQHDGHCYAVAFVDGIGILLCDGDEIYRERITVRTFDGFLEHTIACVFGKSAHPVSTERSKKIRTGKIAYLDVFTARPLCLDEQGKAQRYGSRVMRQSFSVGNKCFDLSLKSAAALYVSENYSARLYSLPSCVHNVRAANEQYQRLFQMVKSQIDSDDLRRVRFPLPDIYNEFQLSAVRRAAHLCFSEVHTMPRSIAVLFREMQQHNFKKFRDGDFALVVDYVRGRASLTLVQTKFYASVERALPETRGLTWEKHPVYQDPIEDSENKLNDLLLKNGLQASENVIKQLLETFGVKGLPLESGRLGLEFYDEPCAEEDASWFFLTREVTDAVQEMKFDVTHIVRNYLQRMNSVLSGKTVYIYIISPQLRFFGQNAILRQDADIPLLGMRHYDALCRQIAHYEEETGEQIPSLWCDQLPELAIKRLFGVYELIGAATAHKVSPQFGIAQPIPITEKFTLPKGRNEYRFGLIMGKNNKDISYEAVVRHPVFPLAEDTECCLRLSYTYGKDIPYELVFTPSPQKFFHEAIVSWETVAERPYEKLQSPVFPATHETWESLQHGKTRKKDDSDFLDWIENVFQKRTVIDFEHEDCIADINERSHWIYVQMDVDDEPAIIQIYDREEEFSECEGKISCVLESDKKQRYKVYFESGDWKHLRNGSYLCVKPVDVDGTTLEIGFFDNQFLFEGDFDEDMDGWASFSLQPPRPDGKRNAMNIVMEDASVPYKFYIGKKPKRDSSLFYLQKLDVLYPLHQVYANGRTSWSPGCPEHFKQRIQELSEDLPDAFVKAWQRHDSDMARKLFRIMCIMALDIGTSLYEAAEVVLKKRPELVDDDLGCALGDYDREEQQKLLFMLPESDIEEGKVIQILGKAAWKSDGFMKNAPPHILLAYFDKCIPFICDYKKYESKGVLRRLEYVLAVFRLRERNDNDINRKLSLNNPLMRKLYVALEEMIEDGYELPESRIQLEVKQNAEFKERHIPDFYYVLLVYITGGNDEIAISGVTEVDAEDS